MIGLWGEGEGAAAAAGADGTPQEDALSSFVVWVLLLAKTHPEILVAHLGLGFLILYIASFLPPFKGAAFKVRCYVVGMIHFFASKESKVSSTDRTKPTRPCNLTNESDVVSKEFIFIRHAESEWNEIFNRGKLMLLPRLLLGIVREVFYFPFKDKSVFLDSCVGPVGKTQTEELANALRRNPALASVADQGSTEARNKSVIMCSNLRRCVQTVLLGLGPRFEKSRENIYLYSCLQEAARNVDTLSITPAQGVPTLTDCPFTELLDGRYNFGSKRWHERSVKRMNIFLKFAFAREESRVVVVGHSLYFKKFFAEFIDEKVAAQLPEDDAARQAMKKKLSNCGVVRFRVQRGNGPLVNAYRIVPDSVQMVHGKWI